MPRYQMGQFPAGPPDHFWGMFRSKHWWTRSPDQVLARWSQ